MYNSSNPLTVGKVNKLTVLATTTQLSDFVKNIGKDKINIIQIYNPGVDPHEYEPTYDDIKNILDSKLIIINGLDLEKRLQKSLDSTKGRIFNASNYIEVLGSDKDSSGDPHIWFSIGNAKKIVSNITITLSEMDPINKDFYSINEVNYLNQLNDAEKYIKEKISELPLEKRRIVSNHDAFGYYFKEYGLNFVGSIIPSLSTETQPSAKDTIELINKIKNQNVKAIFTESSINPKLAQQIAEETHIKIVSNLYGDSLGALGTEGEDYLKMMKYNTDSIVNNLK